MANILKSVWNSVKPYVPAIVGTVAGAYTGGTAGPLMALAGLGMSSSNEARKAQKDAEQRQFNYTQQLNAEMNAYNTPEAQMERYIKAGINPYMASVSSGTQGSAGSVSTSSAGGDAINRAFTIANAVEDIRSKTLANDSQEITNEYLPAQIKATIGETLNKSSLAKYQAELAEHDAAVNYLVGGNYATSKDNALFRLASAIGASATDRENLVNFAIAFRRENGYYPTYEELRQSIGKTAYFKGVPKR